MNAPAGSSNLDLQPTDFLDYRSDEVQDFVERWAPAAANTAVERAVSLYYAVRDKVRYEIYGADFSRSGLRASQVLRARSGMCIHKSVLYAATLRAIAVPSRLVLTDVRNHLASERPPGTGGRRRLPLSLPHVGLPGRPLGQGDTGVPQNTVQTLRNRAAGV